MVGIVWPASSCRSLAARSSANCASRRRPRSSPAWPSPARGRRRNRHRSSTVRGRGRPAARASARCSSSPLRKATAWARLATAMTSIPSTTAASAAFRPAQQAANRLAAAAMAIEGPPWWAALPSRANSPTTATAPEIPRRPGRCPPGCPGRWADRTSGVLGHVGRGQVDDTRLCGRWKPELTIARSTRWVLSLTAASGGRPGGFRQAAGRDIHLDFDRQGVDADQGVGLEFGEHNRFPLSLREQPLVAPEGVVRCCRSMPSKTHNETGKRHCNMPPDRPKVGGTAV